ncbi:MULTISPECIES: hypothetical protein [Pseudomonas]|uniref:hypothetical protein n=1 Tax=Pseudomonas TaxID=286 RepID=UPI000697B6FB|nr:MULTISPECIES: hypothetical protein [Pseudomonas]
MKHTHAPNPSALSPELRKAYCTQLLKVLLRYSTPVELQRLTSLIESHADEQLAARFLPGLNDARYDVYRRFFLKEEAK